MYVGGYRRIRQGRLGQGKGGLPRSVCFLEFSIDVKKKLRAYLIYQYTYIHTYINTHTETLALGRNKDGPSKFLLSVIDEHHGEAPGDWPGYRDEGGGH